MRDRDSSAKVWIPYIPYLVKQRLQRNGYLQLVWGQSKDQWEYSHAIDDSLKKVQLITRNVMIGGLLAKNKKSPPLRIEPLPCPSFKDWLFCPTAKPKYEEIQQLLRYFSALCGDGLGKAAQKRQGDNLRKKWSALLGEEVTADMGEAVGRLADILTHWHREYFHGDGVPSPSESTPQLWFPPAVD